MTLFKPTIIVNRLNVFKEGKRVLDISFSKGLNIVYGDNSTGKSSVLEFIFYCLGGAAPRWQPVARTCDEVVCEIEVNGDLLTIRREISENSNSMPSMDLYYDGIDVALAAASGFWERYPYSRTSSKDSFSQVLFNILGMPAVPANDGANVTMHQVLRLVYSDQMTAADEIFRSDRFDKHLTKEMVGELICGVYSPQLYELSLTKAELSKELAEVRGELNSFISLLSSSTDSFSVKGVKNAISANRLKQDNLLKQLERIQEDVDNDAGDTKGKESEKKGIEKKLRKLSGEVDDLNDKLSFLGFDIRDSQLFLDDLGRNLTSLMDSDLTSESFGNIHFEYCPCCLEPLSPREEHGHCQLCGSPEGGAHKGRKRLRLKRELEMQIAESSEILSQKKVEAKRITKEIREKNIVLRRLRLQYQNFSNPTSSYLLSILKQKYGDLGYLQKEEEELNERLGISEKIASLSDRKSVIAGELSEIEDKILSFEKKREKRKAKAFNRISEWCRDFLHMDLNRQMKFKSAEFINFDFSASREVVSVDGERKFSASSMVYLKNAFLLSLLFASLEDKKFCFPRLLFLDGIEDKGMEVARVHHLQRLIADFSEDFDVDHQIIITAEKLADEFIGSDYVVNKEKYTSKNKSIDLSASA
jgi:hypothetical protein